VFRPARFQSVLQGLGIPPTAQTIPSACPESKLTNFLWKNDIIEIVTACNPITGEFRKEDPNCIDRTDYASYMGLRSFNKETLDVAVTLIRYHAFIKDESKGELKFVGFPKGMPTLKKKTANNRRVTPNTHTAMIMMNTTISDKSKFCKNLQEILGCKHPIHYLGKCKTLPSSHLPGCYSKEGGRNDVMIAVNDKDHYKVTTTRLGISIEGVNQLEWYSEAYENFGKNIWPVRFIDSTRKWK